MASTTLSYSVLNGFWHKWKPLFGWVEYIDFDHRNLLASYLSAYNFTELHLDCLYRGPGDITPLPKEIFTFCVNTKVLSLRNNYLECLPSDIGRMSKLCKLYLTNNRLQNSGIPYTLQFLKELNELYLDNNLLDALPSYLLTMKSLKTVHRHGNHNYFKSTFMWWVIINCYHVRS